MSLTEIFCPQIDTVTLVWHIYPSMVIVLTSFPLDEKLSILGKKHNFANFCSKIDTSE